MLDSFINRDMKILVVDDFSVMRRIVKNLLIELGFKENNIKEAEDGAIALNQITSYDYDFIVSDWNMPNMTGLEFLQNVRTLKDKNKHRIPFLMVTAEAKRSQILEAAQSGVNGYVIKPFNSQTLEEKINLIFKRIELSK